MKKSIILTFAILSLSSCKKVYTCACPPPHNVDADLIETKIFATKSKAEEKCNATVNPYSSFFGDAPDCYIE